MVKGWFNTVMIVGLFAKMRCISNVSESILF